MSRDEAIEALYKALVADAWNCYRRPELYRKRFAGGRLGVIQREWWAGLVDKVQYKETDG